MNFENYYEITKPPPSLPLFLPYYHIYLENFLFKIK
jgi:hypothetical protein